MKRNEIERMMQDDSVLKCEGDKWVAAICLVVAVVLLVVT